MPVERAALRLMVIEYTCAERCMGRRGNRGGCCHVDDRDWIIGPVRDVDAFIEQLSAALGRSVTRAEAVIDYEEGRALFPDRAMWQNPDHYPAMRVLDDDPRHPCRYYDSATAACTVHAVRPGVCRDYQCEALASALSSVL